MLPYSVLKHKYLCLLSTVAAVLWKKINILCSFFYFQGIEPCALISLGRDCRKWSADLLPVFKSSLRTFNLFYLIFSSQFAAQDCSQLQRDLHFGQASTTCSVMIEIWTVPWLASPWGRGWLALRSSPKMHTHSPCIKLLILLEIPSDCAKRLITGT